MMGLINKLRWAVARIEGNARRCWQNPLSRAKNMVSAIVEYAVESARQVSLSILKEVPD